jgi:hypothetical protein
VTITLDSAIENVSKLTERKAKIRYKRLQLEQFLTELETTVTDISIVGEARALLTHLDEDFEYIAKELRQWREHMERLAHGG